MRPNDPVGEKREGEIDGLLITGRGVGPRQRESEHLPGTVTSHWPREMRVARQGEPIGERAGHMGDEVTDSSSRRAIVFGAREHDLDRAYTATA